MTLPKSQSTMPAVISAGCCTLISNAFCMHAGGQPGQPQMPDMAGLMAMLGGGGGMPGMAGMGGMPGLGGEGIPPVANPEEAYANQLTQLQARVALH